MRTDAERSIPTMNVTRLGCSFQVVFLAPGGDHATGQSFALLEYRALNLECHSDTFCSSGSRPVCISLSKEFLSQDAG
jgi:hypothetical protein